MRLSRVGRTAQPVRRAILPRRDPLHHLRPGSGVPLSLGGQPRPDRLGGLGDDDDLHSGAGARPRLCVEEGSTRLGVELERPAPGTLLPAGTQPDQHFFDALNSEVSDKGFLVTSTRSEEQTSELQSLMRISYA